MSNEPVKEHSPLPWRAANTGEFEWPNVVTKDGLIVAEVLKNSGVRGDAALIVRAVNSLDSSIAAMEAALKAVALLDDVMDVPVRVTKKTTELADRYDALGDVAAKLRAAIALARGNNA